MSLKHLTNFPRFWDTEQEDLLFRLFTVEHNSEAFRMLDPAMPREVGGLVVYICLQGQGEFFIDHKSYFLQKNDIFIVTPGSIFQPKAKSNDLKGYILGLDTDFFTKKDTISGIPLYFHIRENPCISMEEEDIKEVIEICDLIKNKVKRVDHIYRKEIAENLLMTLFYEISSLYQKGRPVVRKSRKRNEELFEKFLYLVANHSNRERRLEFYADEMCLTTKYLSSVVKQTSGKSAAQWITESVVMNAKTLLRNSGLTVQQVANELNFPNASFFGQYFKKHTGRTPKAFRQIQ